MEEYLWVLKASELDMIREIEEERMAELNEEELLSLHKRIRRARNKHVGNYRRKAAVRVAEHGGRGTARPGNKKSLLRAEAFEEALSRVSRRLAVVAHEEAEVLKQERLARAQAGKSSGPAATVEPGSDVAGEGRDRTHSKTTGGIKRDASSSAQGDRRQAARDSRQ